MRRALPVAVLFCKHLQQHWGIHLLHLRSWACLRGNLWSLARAALCL